MKKDLEKELLLVAINCVDFTHVVAVFGLQNLLKFILSDLTLPDDFDCEEFIADVKLMLDESISVGDYEITVQVASNYSKSQIMNYFEHE